MTATLIPLKPSDVAERLRAGGAVLVDIRESDEFARQHVAGALSHPLAALERAHLRLEPARDVIFACRTGMRTGANCDRLAALVEGEAFVLEGGVDAWSAAGLPLAEDRKAPLELQRQVQIAAGGLVMLGVGLGVLARPAWLGVAAFVGAGLVFAGATGTCGMARILAAAPWNRVEGT